MNACCTRIPVTSSTFSWVDVYLTVIWQFGDIYLQTFARRSLEQTILLDELPQSVLKNPSTSVKQYFSWIKEIHNVLLTWKTKLDNNDANYDEIHEYSLKQNYIHKIAQHVSTTSLVIPTENFTVLKNAFLEKFEELNILLLKYVSGDSKLGW